MIIDDKVAMLRLAGHPELALRHDEFVTTYGRTGDPGLVVQLRPVEQDLTLNLEVPDVLARLSRGAQSQHGYWDSFRATAHPRPTLHGVSSLPTGEKPRWALEAHRDGHFIAGVWEFPAVEGNEGQALPSLPGFFGKMIEDFFAVVATVVAPVSPSRAFNATATISGTDVLNFMKKSDFGDQWVRGAGPLQRRLVQLPIYPAQLGAVNWQPVAAGLARAMCGAYGNSYVV